MSSTPRRWVLSNNAPAFSFSLAKMSEYSAVDRTLSFPGTRLVPVLTSNTYLSHSDCCADWLWQILELQEAAGWVDMIYFTKLCGLITYYRHIYIGKSTKATACQNGIFVHWSRWQDWAVPRSVLLDCIPLLFLSVASQLCSISINPFKSRAAICRFFA